jgi:hypothetical protein
MPRIPLDTGLNPKAVDYAEEGRLLLSRVNLGSGLAPERYAPTNVLYKHPETGAELHVGNAQAAKSIQILDGLGEEGCRRIVFCQVRHYQGDFTLHAMQG